MIFGKNKILYKKEGYFKKKLKEFKKC